MSEPTKSPADPNEPGMQPRPWESSLTLDGILAEVDADTRRAKASQAPTPPAAVPGAQGPYQPTQPYQPAQPYQPTQPYAVPQQPNYPPQPGGYYPYQQPGYPEQPILVNTAPYYYAPKKHNSILAHALLFVFTGGIGNLVYAGYIWHWNSTHGY